MIQHHSELTASAKGHYSYKKIPLVSAIHDWDALISRNVTDRRAAQLRERMNRFDNCKNGKK